MMQFENKSEFGKTGFVVLSSQFSREELSQLDAHLEEYKSKEKFDNDNPKDLYAIRRLFYHIPELQNIIFNQNVINIVREILGEKSFMTKAIYFDKPPLSNWFVSYHQDISISVKDKLPIDDYQNWTFKKGQYGVQPPVDILQNCITLRIHLDHTDKFNGALKVIPNSHLEGIQRLDYIKEKKENEVICEVERGGVMLMKPLLFHSSGKTLNNKRRRVIHLEFSNKNLDGGIEWLEKLEYMH